MLEFTLFDFYVRFSNFFHLPKNIYLISTETFDDNL